ncbi:MAG: hypothetical protein ACERKY_11950 [Anaerolineales bacterium]
MFGSDSLEVLFVVWSFFIQFVLIVHFASRKWAFERYTWKYGWIVYALSIPSVLVSLVILFGGKPWSFWLGGFIFLVWAIYGYRIDYVQQRRWRNPVNWRIGGPYVTLYLATIMFYWWPLGLISRTLWFLYAGLFVISTWLNITSHHPSKDVATTKFDEEPVGSGDMS